MTETAVFMTRTPEPSGGGGCVAPDLLSDSLALLRIRGHVGSRTEAKAPWGLQLPPGDSYFHVIERGSCSLQLDGAADAIRLETGDAVILPHGHPHRLSDVPGRKVVSLAQALESQRDGVVRLGAKGAATDIICGAFRFDSAAGHPLLESLPPLMHVRGVSTRAVEYKELAQRLLVHEVRNPHLGGEAMIARLVELLFVQAVRSWIDAQPEGDGGWLVALRHPTIRTVLGKLHASPAHEWTVAELAAQAHVSRSSLAALFRRLVGVSPMAYLGRWRLLLAARILRDEGLSIREAADRVGYEADAAFSRAFKRQFGVAPGTYRERASGEVGLPRGTVVVDQQRSRLIDRRERPSSLHSQ
jgi:AraC-like DNA-binding protein